jgi:hypothetical protein
MYLEITERRWHTRCRLFYLSKLHLNEQRRTGKRNETSGNHHWNTAADRNRGWRKNNHRENGSIPTPGIVSFVCQMRPGSASLYFHQNPYTPDGQKLIITTPNGLSAINLNTRAIEKIVDGRVAVSSWAERAATSITRGRSPTTTCAQPLSMRPI